MNGLINEYFDWLYDLVCGDRFGDRMSYRELFKVLFDTKFTYSIPMDSNRASDGVNLRYRFQLDHGYGEKNLDILIGDCTVLEMLIALAIRCEEQIMDDPEYGNRTGQWFWTMIRNLNLKTMFDGDSFDIQRVRTAVDRFLNRQYDPDGRGNIFYIPGCMYDLRTIEIWAQLCWYLDTIV